MKINLREIILIALLLALAMVGCAPSSEETELRLQEAVAALEGDNAEEARTLAGKLLADTAAMDGHQLATLAYVYMRLSELADNSIDAPQALMCYHAAVSKAPSAAGSLISAELPGAVRIEDILNKLDGNLRNPASLSDEPDSCGVEPQTIAQP